MTSDMSDGQGDSASSDPPAENTPTHPLNPGTTGIEARAPEPTDEAVIKDPRVASPPPLPPPFPEEEQRKKVIASGDQSVEYHHQTGLIRILVTVAFHLLVKLTRLAIGKAHSHSELPHIYHMNGSPAVVVDGYFCNHKRVKLITSPENMQELISQCAFFYKRGRSKDEGDIPDNPSPALCKAVIAAPEGLPELKGIVNLPLLRDDGTINQEPGYDWKTGYYFDPGEMPPITVSEHPTKENVAQALAIIRKPFADFPFKASADYANYLALLLTLIARSVIPGNTPLFVIDSPVQGSGKSKLAFCANLISTGGQEAPM